MLSPAVLKFTFFTLIVAAVGLEVVGDILFKKWAITNKNTLLLIGLLFYFAGTAFWALSLKYEFLSKAIIVFTIFNLIIVILAGTIIFGEKLSVLNKTGILLGIISIILLEI